MTRRRAGMGVVRLLVLIAALLVAAEAALRIDRYGLSPAALGRWQPRIPWPAIRTIDEQGPWPRAGGSASWALQAGSPEIEYRVDADGFRVAAGAVPRRGACRVLALGDSNVFGYGVRAEEAFPAALEGLLRERGVDADVKNAGVCASDVAQQRRWLEAAVERASPDVVILAVSPWSLRTDRPQDRTDLSLAEKLARVVARASSPPAAWSAVVDRTRRRLLHALGAFTSWLPTSDADWHLRPLLEPRPEFELRFEAAATQVRQMVGRLRAKSLTPVLLLIPLDVQTTTSRNDIYVAERLPYPSWGFVDRDYTRDPRYADDMARLAESLAVPLIDVTPTLVTHASESYLQNDYHLSAAGHRRIVDVIAAPVRDACQQAAVASN
jgi:lysophospholipase L1-like esterase